MLSEAHAAVSEHHRLETLYNAQSDKYPWVSALKKQRVTVVDHLIKLCVDVYNDSLYETLTAHNWPARSLAVLHAAHVSRDMDATFVPYEPSGADLHYRDPVIYREMLDVITNTECEALHEQIKSSLVFAIHWMEVLIGECWITSLQASAM